MRVFPFIWPGAHVSTEGADIKTLDYAWSGHMKMMLKSLTGAFGDAWLALELFEPAVNSLHEGGERMRREFEIRREISRSVSAQLAEQHRHEPGAYDSVIERTLSGAQFLQRLAMDGVLPHEVCRRGAFMHARSFLYALDSFDKALQALLQDLSKDPAREPEVFKDVYKRQRLCVSNPMKFRIQHE